MNDQLPPPERQAPPPPAPPQYAPPGFTNPQYVVTHRSHHGVGGWLGVWMVLFTLGAINWIVAFIWEVDGRRDVANLIFFPLIGVLAAASVALIAMRRRLARWTSIAALASTWLYSTIKIVDTGGSAAAKLTGISAVTLVEGALILYFVHADRVRHTLIR
jgi:apolipoprotein N-acyltransferase